MPHLEEGQIHAWLDGALAADEAVVVERHATECAECSARVAEARGFIAASSRILAKLDHVPAVRGAGVVAPTRAPGAPGAKGSATATAGAGLKVARWFRPSYAAAAALLIVAVGTWGVMRRVDVGSLGRTADGSPVDAPRPEMMDSQAVTLPSAAKPAELAKAEAQRVPAASAGERRELRQEQARSKEREVLADAADRRRDEASRTREEALARANEQKVMAPPARPEAVAAASTQAGARPADSTRVSEADARRPVAPTTQRTVARTAVPVDSLIARERSRILGEVVPTGVAAAAPQAARSAAQIDSLVNALAGCYTVTAGMRAEAEGVPARLTLLTRPHRTIGNDQTWIASVGPSVPRTVEWEWSIDAGFNVVIRRTPNGAALSTSFAATPPADVVLRRTECR